MTTLYFNSQPHKEADSALIRFPVTTFLFQLTASQGGWPQLPILLSVCSDISTHSLTRRLTLGIFLINLLITISTHSLTRRLTRCFGCIRTGSAYFNSQPHKEADQTGTTTYYPCYISTHSLTRRLTYQAGAMGGNYQISTHSLTRRLTVISKEEFQAGVDFNSQPHKEADTKSGWNLPPFDISTHSLTRRLTGRIFTYSIIFDYFNSQPHKEADDDGAVAIHGDVYISTHSLTRRLTWARTTGQTLW